jgi:hypothetical protein
MDPITLQELSLVKGREDAREALSEHGLARARRPRQEEVMATGGGDLDGETPHRLAPHFREVERPGTALPARSVGGCCSWHPARLRRSRRDRPQVGPGNSSRQRIDELAERPRGAHYRLTYEQSLGNA